MFIEIRPAYCRMEGTKEEKYWLRDLLTFDVPGAKYTTLFRFGRWDGKKRMFNMVAGTFPIGLLNYVTEGATIAKIKLDLKDIRPTIEFDLSEEHSVRGIELRDYQKAAITKCLEVKSCIVQAATNAGKTAMFAGIIKYMNPHPTLVLTHREEIFHQLKGMVEKYLGVKMGVILSEVVDIRPITVAMVPTLVNRIGADERITEYFETLKCIVVDECHHAESKSFASILAGCPATYRFGFSGTIPPSGSHKGMLVRQWIGDVAFEIDNETLIQAGISAKPKVSMFEIDVSTVLHHVHQDAKAELASEGDYTTQQLMRRVYTLTMHRGVVTNTERNGKALEVIRKHPGKSVLLIVDMLAHGELVEKMLNQAGVNAVFISGQSEVRKQALDLFKLGKLKILISTSILDEGVDVSGIEVLILLAGKKSKRQLLQRVGRGLRKKKEGENVLHLYDFLDYGSRYLERHAKERYSIYKAERFNVEFI